MMQTKPLMNEYPDLVHPSMNGIVGIWNFNERGGDTVYDQSGNHGDGIVDDTGMWIPGGLNFDGADKVSITDSNALDFGTGNITIIFGLNLPSTGSGDFARTIAVKMDLGGGTAPGFSIVNAISTGKLRASFGQPSNNLARTYRDSGTSLADGITHCITVRWINSTGDLNFYIDGIPDDGSYGDTTGAEINVNSDQPLYLGYDTPNSRWPLLGTTNYFRIYNRALPLREIQYQYNYPYAAWYRDDSALFVASAASGAGTPATFNPAWALSSNQVLI